MASNSNFEIFLSLNHPCKCEQNKGPNEFENKPVLKFMYKLNLNKKLTFLDVLVNTENNEFKTTVYRKDTKMGICNLPFI